MKKQSDIYESMNSTNNYMKEDDFKTDLIICGTSLSVVVVLVIPWLVGIITLIKWMIF